LYGINFAPELTGIGKYTGEMAEWLAAQGASVTVVTAPPYYPAWRVEPPYRAHRYRREKVGGADVVRCPLFVPRRLTGLKRLLHLASFALSSLPVIAWLAIRQRPDLVMVIEPPLFAAPAAWLAARLAGADAWLHVQDFEIDAAFELGLLRSGRARADRCERWLMRRFDRVTTISARMLDRLLAKGVPRGRAALLPNWVDLDRIRPLAAARSAEREAAPVVALYSGNMGLKQGLETVLRAAQLLHEAGDTRLRFVFCGDGVARPALERAAGALPNVAFRPLVPAERLNWLLNEADVHVLPQRAGAEDLVFPSKLTNMLASGRPVVATANAGTEIATLLEGCGLRVPPEDPAALAAALRSLADDADLRQSLGAQARRTAERLWDKRAVLAAAFAPYLPAGAHERHRNDPDRACAPLRTRR
jgi:colanic acid biosynthesis glycosyl transferase WcaI